MLADELASEILRWNDTRHWMAVHLSVAWKQQFGPMCGITALSMALDFLNQRSEPQIWKASIAGLQFDGCFSLLLQN